MTDETVENTKHPKNPQKRVPFSDAFLRYPDRNLPPAKAGGRAIYADTILPGLKVRVTDKGKRTFILWHRFGGAKNPSARSLGEVGVVSLAEARQKARGWLEMAKAGKDPVVVQAEQLALEATQNAEEDRLKAAEAARSEATFGRAVGRYFEYIAHQRQAAGVMSEFRRDLLSCWKDKPLTEITRKDVKERVREIAQDTIYQAHAAFGNIRTFFNWARDEGDYGLESVPTDGMRAEKIVGQPKKYRKRVLDDDELFAFWKAAEEIPYPLGPGYKVLLLTAARVNEIMEADRRELDPAENALTVPPERFKSDESHFLPFSTLTAEIVAGLPRWNAGTFIFSRDGVKPARFWTKDRKALSARMELILKGLAEARGQDPLNVKLKPFVLHDLRRTVRTRLSQLKVPHEIREMIIGHGKKGLDRVYDQWEFRDEMRDALERWAALLLAMVEEKEKVFLLGQNQVICQAA
jgi:integrase